jgi:hypothetical protein
MANGTSACWLPSRIIAAIVDGTAPADLTVTGLAKALPYSWAEQEEGLNSHVAPAINARAHSPDTHSRRITPSVCSNLISDRTGKETWPSVVKLLPKQP